MNKNDFFFFFGIWAYFVNFIFFNFNLYDALFKLNLNAAYAAFAHFWWISFLLVYVFSFCIFRFNFNNHLPHIFLGFSYVLIFYWIELQAHFFSNFSFLIFNQNFSLANFLLINSFNKYHPALLYFSLVFFFYASFVSLFFLFFKISLPRIAHLQIITIRATKTFPLIAAALILGAWWAQQEGSWGGWWNWDPSENLGLIVFFASALSLHFAPTRFLFFKFNFFFKNWLEFVIFIFFYLLLQLNFDLLSHNFGLRFFFFFNNNLFFINLAVCFSFFFGAHNSIFLQYKSRIVANSKSRKLPRSIIYAKNYFWAALAFVLTAYGAIIFENIFNFFFWQFFNYQFANSAQFFLILNFFFLSVLVCLLPKTLISPIAPLYAINFYQFFATPRFFRKTIVAWLHLALVLNLFILLFSNYYPVLTYAMLNPLSTLPLASLTYAFLPNNYGIDGLYLTVAHYVIAASSTISNWALSNTFLHENVYYFWRIVSNASLLSFFPFTPAFEINFFFSFFIDHLYVNLAIANSFVFGILFLQYLRRVVLR